MGQMLPLLLDWLSVTPDPDLGLLGLRNLLVHPHQRSRLVTVFRESPEAAKRLCLLLGSSTSLGEAVGRNPSSWHVSVTTTPSPSALPMSSVPKSPSGSAPEVRARTSGQRGSHASGRHSLRVLRPRHLLDLDDAGATGTAISNVAEVVLEAALAIVDPEIPFCIIGLGHFGGGGCPTRATSTSSSSTTIWTLRTT